LLLSQWALAFFLVHSFTLAASRPLWRRQRTHSSFAAITDRQRCRDSLLNFSQTVGLCLCLHCGESEHTSTFSSSPTLSLGGPGPPLGDCPLMMSISDIPSPLSSYSDCVQVALWPASTLPFDQTTGPQWSLPLQYSNTLQAANPAERLLTAGRMRPCLGPPPDISLCSLSWPGRATRLVPHGCAKDARLSCGCPPGSLGFTSPPAGKSTPLWSTLPLVCGVR
jgi:hypothetical protein